MTRFDVDTIPLTGLMLRTMKSGDKIQTLAGTTATVPYTNEHPCFGQRQGWCRNLATWRMEGPHLVLHFCEDCKKRPELNGPGNEWTKLKDSGSRAFTA